MEMVKNEDFIQHHCSEEAVLLAQSGDYRVLTTYRHPEDVAESWRKRRYGWDTKQWREQWKCYADIVPLAEVFRTEDLPYHLGVEENPLPPRPPHPLDDILEKMIQIDIDFAVNLTREVLGAKFVETRK